MRVLNVNSTLGLNTGGGNAERTFQMSRFLAIGGIQSTVLTLDIELDEQRIVDLLPASIIVLPCLWKRFYFPWVKWKIIRQSVQHTDIIHIMGHWSVLNAVVYLAVRLANKPYVVCPAGALHIFGRSQIKKKLYNWIIGYSIIHNASGWIAVTNSEFSQFKEYGICESKIKVIPNGINTEDFQPVKAQDFLDKNGLTGSKIILFMGRLNLIKGPDILLNAFIKAQEYIHNYQLVFAGPDGGMLVMLQERAQEAGITEMVHFVGYISGHDKLAAYQAAKLLVVPSRQEAMSIVALEAMLCATPVLMTDQCGFGEIKSINPNLEVDVDVEKIAKKLVLLLTNEESLEEVGSLLKEFAMRNYSWNKVILNFMDMYGDIIKNSPKQRM